MLAVAVVAARAFRRDPAFAQVFRDHGGFALGDVAVAARARRDEADAIAGADRHIGELAGRGLAEGLGEGLPVVAPRSPVEEAARRPGPSAEQPQGRIL